MRRKGIIRGMGIALAVLTVIGIGGGWKDSIGAKVYAAAGDVAVDRVNFPDEIFRQYVGENFDKDKNGILSADECKDVIDINVRRYIYSDSEISSLKGIEFFPELLYLDCKENDLSSLDVSQNAKLLWLNCASCNLSSLDVSKNVELRDLDCNYNNLSSLDVSQNKKLFQLWCQGNDLTSLDLTQNEKLGKLHCFRNNLDSLDVSQNKELFELKCWENNLSSLDVSQNVELKILDCNENNLSSLNVRPAVKLEDLNCNTNHLSSLDISQNVNLQEMNCYKNDLSSLDVSQNINLTWLSCGQNTIRNLDVSQNRNLTWLSCSDNPISSLDVSQNRDLIMLDCENNALSSLDLSQNTELVTLLCAGNHLSSIDLSQTKVISSTNVLNQSDLSGNTIDLCIYKVDDGYYMELPVPDFSLVHNTRHGFNGEGLIYDKKTGRIHMDTSFPTSHLISYAYGQDGRPLLGVTVTITEVIDLTTPATSTEASATELTASTSNTVSDIPASTTALQKQDTSGQDAPRQNTPKTGDRAMVLWIAVLGIFSAVCYCLSGRMRRR